MDEIVILSGVKLYIHICYATILAQLTLRNQSFSPLILSCILASVPEFCLPILMYSGSPGFILHVRILNWMDVTRM